MKKKKKDKALPFDEISALKQRISELEATSKAHATDAKELRDTKDFLDNIIENSLDSIVITDEMGYISRVNRFFLELTGYTEKEVLGRHISSFSPMQEGLYKSTTGEVVTIGKEYFDDIKANYTSLVENGRISLWETLMIRKDRKVIPVEENVVYLFDIKNNIIGAVGFIRDITKRKKTEMEILKMRDSLRNKVIELSIINDISEVLLSTRELREILHIILVGATSFHGLGFNRAFLFLMDEMEQVLNGTIATGSINISEAYKPWTKPGDEKHSLKEILKTEQGKLSEQDNKINDLVKSIRISLADKRSLFAQSVFLQKSYNLINATPASHVDREFIKKTGCNSFALVPLVARGKTLGVLVADNFVTKKPISDEDVERLRAFANHASLAIENSHLYRSIEEKVEELSRAYHELQKNRDKLVRYERLSTVGEMAAKIAHDIRNPLTAVGGFARRLLKKDLDPTSNRKYLEIIVKEIERMEEILSDILSFTAPSEPELTHVNINEIINSTVEIFSIEAEQRDISIIKKLDPKIPEMLIDENQIRRVLANIIKNGVEAIPGRGTITVTSRVDNGMIVIEIHDTGVGIPEEDINRLFEPFFTTKSNGSGLGLTLSSQIIENHGGEIEIKEKKPSGTIFIIKLPVKTPSDTSH